MLLFLPPRNQQYPEGHLHLETAINNFHDGYFSTCPRSSKTKKAYSKDLSQFCDFIGSTQMFEEIRVDKLENWAMELRDRKYAPVSIRRKFATLRVFFSYWFRRGIIESSP